MFELSKELWHTLFLGGGDGRKNNFSSTVGHAFVIRWMSQKPKAVMPHQALLFSYKVMVIYLKIILVNISLSEDIHTTPKKIAPYFCSKEMTADVSRAEFEDGSIQRRNVGDHTKKQTYGDSFAVVRFLENSTHWLQLQSLLITLGVSYAWTMGSFTNKA